MSGYEFVGLSPGSLCIRRCRAGLVCRFCEIEVMTTFVYRTEKFTFYTKDGRNPERLIQTARQLIDLCETRFNIKFPLFDLINDPSLDNAPITYRNQNRIHITCPFAYNVQFAYQVSHELCHLAIPGEVCIKLRWFEETFAVLSSLIFPFEIPDIEPERYLSMITRTALMHPPLCVNSPCIPGRQMIQLLESGSGTANFNDYGSYFNIGAALLPTVQKSHDIWKAIPYLNRISGDKSFYAAMLEWQEIVPSNIRDAVSIIVGAFLSR